MWFNYLLAASFAGGLLSASLPAGADVAARYEIANEYEVRHP